MGLEWLGANRDRQSPVHRGLKAEQLPARQTEAQMAKHQGPKPCP